MATSSPSYPTNQMTEAELRHALDVNARRFEQLQEMRRSADSPDLRLQIRENLQERNSYDQVLTQKLIQNRLRGHSPETVYEPVSRYPQASSSEATRPHTQEFERGYSDYQVRLQKQLGKTSPEDIPHVLKQYQKEVEITSQHVKNNAAEIHNSHFLAAWKNPDYAMGAQAAIEDAAHTKSYEFRRVPNKDYSLEMSL